MARNRSATPSAGAAPSTAPAGRGTRSTRSRTHEPAPALATQPAKSRNQRANRAKSVESNASAGSRGARSRRRANAPQEVEVLDMTTIQEDEDLEDVDVEMPPPDDVPESRDFSEEVYEEANGGGPSFHSMSGTTARSFQSDDDEAFPPQVLIEHGPRIYETAVNIIKRFDQHMPNLHANLKGIDKAGSGTQKSFNKDVKVFNEAQSSFMAPYGGELDILLSPEEFILALFNNSPPNKTAACWHVVEFIQLLNLAVICRLLAGASDDEMVPTEKLVALDVQFPKPFLNNISDSDPKIVGNSAFEEETFDAGIAIRMEAAVLEIQRMDLKEDDLDAFVMSRFYASTDSQDNLRTWDADGLGRDEYGLGPKQLKKLNARIRQFQSAAELDLGDIEDGSETGMENMARAFPWFNFRASVLRWARLRMEELTASIDGSGGIENLMAEIETELQKEPAAQRVESAQVSPAKQKAKVILSNSQQRQESIPILPSSPVQSQTAQARRLKHPRDDNSQYLRPSQAEGNSRSAAYQAVINKGKEMNKQMKENRPTSSAQQKRRYNEAQPDAVRIESFEDSQPEPSNSRKRKTPPPAEEDVSDDDGFQEDNRDVDMSQNRRNAPPRPPKTSPKKKARFAGEEDENIVMYERQSEMMGRQASQATTIAHLSPRRPKQRVKWTPTSEYMLEKLIGQYGTSWSYLKQVDENGENHFEGRDQVALKDKARNMKVQMLLNGLALPRNFDKIPLGKKEIARVEAAGIVYDGN